MRQQPSFPLCAFVLLGFFPLLSLAAVPRKQLTDPLSSAFDGMPQTVTLSVDSKSLTLNEPSVFTCKLSGYSEKPFSTSTLFYLNTTLGNERAIFIPLGTFDTFGSNEQTSFAKSGDAAKDFGDFIPDGDVAFDSYKLAIRITKEGFKGSFGCKLTWAVDADEEYGNQLIHKSILSNVWSSGVGVTPSVFVLVACVMMTAWTRVFL